MAERVLVTGGAGFIGLQVARSLRALGSEVVILDDFSRGQVDRELTANLRDIRLLRCDLTKPIPEEIANDFTEVYHLAGVVGVRTANTEPEKVLRVNLLSTINLLEACSRWPVRRLFLASTSEVSDGAITAGLAKLPSAEDVPFVLPEPHLPRSAYATSKIASEQLCLSYGRSYGFSVRIVRYYNVYGPRMGHDHVIPQLIGRVLRREDPFKVWGAHQRRAFCYIDDAVKASIALMGLATTNPLVVNVGSDRDEVEIIDLVERILTIGSFAPKLELLPPPSGSPERRRPALASLRDLLGEMRVTGLDEGLQRTFAWYRENALASTSCV